MMNNERMKDIKFKYVLHDTITIKILVMTHLDYGKYTEYYLGEIIFIFDAMNLD